MTTRREFLRASAAAAAAYAIPGAASSAAAQPSQKAGSPSPVQLGLASYTFRNFTRAQLIGFMKQLKVKALNAKDAKDHLPMDPAQEAATLADYSANDIHLHAVGTVSFANPDPSDIRSKFEYAKRAGVSVIVAGDPAPATLPVLQNFAKQYNIRIAIHNHGPEDKLWPSPLTVLKSVRDLDPRMGCCIDVGHCVRAGSDIIGSIHAAGPRLFNMHMKDLTSFTDKESQVAVGEGRMPVLEIFKALTAIRYTGFVDLEYEVHADDPMPGVISSFAYMRGVLAGMGYN